MVCGKDDGGVYRIVGAVLVVVGCALIGKFKVVTDRQTISLIGEFISGINTMICELEFRRTPLPNLCNLVAERTSGVVSGYFAALEKELSHQTLPDVGACSDTAMRQCGDIPSEIRQLLSLTGESLGMFGVDGQVEQLQYIRNIAENLLERAQKNFESLGRSHQTVWICAGIVLAVVMF